MTPDPSMEPQGHHRQQDHAQNRRTSPSPLRGSSRSDCCNQYRRGFLKARLSTRSKSFKQPDLARNSFIRAREDLRVRCADVYFIILESPLKLDQKSSFYEVVGKSVRSGILHLTYRDPKRRRSIGELGGAINVEESTLKYESGVSTQ